MSDLEGRLSIGRVTSSTGPDCIRITVAVAGGRVSAECSLENFSYALTGCIDMPCRVIGLEEGGADAKVK